MKKQKNPPGFTLIELVMAIVIGGIMLTSVLSIFATLPKKNAFLDTFNTALLLADGKMESVCSRSFSAISSEAITPFTGSFTSYSSQVVVNYVASSEPNVSVNPTVTNYKRIQVIVTSTSLPGGIELVNLATDVTNP